MTLARWLVLDCVEGLGRETGAAVSQKQVAQRLNMAEGAVSRLMGWLAGEGLVDRGLSAGPEYRIYSSAAGANAVAAGRAILEAVSVWMDAELGMAEQRRSEVAAGGMLGELGRWGLGGRVGRGAAGLEPAGAASPLGEAGEEDAREGGIGELGDGDGNGLEGAELAAQLGIGAAAQAVSGREMAGKLDAGQSGAGKPAAL
jgi:hypothetical protein